MRTLQKTVCGFSLIASLAIGGCGPKVTRVEVAGPALTITGTQSCSKAGYCFTCLPGFDSKMTCGFKFSAMCPGSQHVTSKETPVRIHYEDKTVRTSTRNEILETSICN